MLEQIIRRNMNAFKINEQSIQQLMTNIDLAQQILNEKLEHMDSQIQQINTGQIIESLKLKDMEFYQEEFKGKYIKEFKSATSMKVYSDLGQHQYPQIDSTVPVQILRDKTAKWIHIGQLQKETGIPDGVGIRVWWDGSIYEGYWSSGQREGFARYIYDDGECYIGDFKNDTRHGQGTCIYQSGEKYVGEWKENFKNGKGTEFKADGSQKRSGKWKDDKFIS